MPRCVIKGKKVGARFSRRSRKCEMSGCYEWKGTEEIERFGRW